MKSLEARVAALEKACEARLTNLKAKGLI